MNTYTYGIRIDERRTRPVIAYIKYGCLTIHTIRGYAVEDVESEADGLIRELKRKARHRGWFIDERTASGVGVVR